MFFTTTAYDLGGQIWTLDGIEHGCLRGNKKKPGGAAPLFADHDPRARLKMAELDPRIHFALNCGAKSCPPIRLFTPEKLDAQLSLAARGFCTDPDNVFVDNDAKTVMLSAIFNWYGADFVADPVVDPASLFLKIASFLDHASCVSQRQALETAAASSYGVAFKPYNWGVNQA